ncbi:TetR/AcrR family transcriptional regulator [Rhodococcus sp. ABRD24]|uniref:TetR/AcrR family transcriptional regulator n=1 Tax=Rhodococcus sp. ABRD24 TaxID=2507582 RepID=UPI00103F0CAA|nr:TetR/AcrR family transcriptional regulator [Rhodococcus sp. ABRD24]QBJ97488.1 TetR/AcrR family transcriptional regulator [Rhodococcus sp. ABRD24]
MNDVATDTRERLLLAAERLLLETGYERVSIRAVCSAAGVNPAAVHYHFGTKESLVAALLEARLGPVWTPSLEALSGRSGDVPECVDAVIEPLIALSADPAGRLYLHLLARLVLGRREVVWAATWFSLEPWAEMLQSRVPGLSIREAQARWMFAFDLLLGQFGDPLAGDRVLSPHAIATLRAFVAAGLSAPVEAR